MSLSDILFPRMFGPIAHSIAVLTTAAILVDAVFETSFLKPWFVTYALSGLYLISVAFEAVWALRGRQVR